MNKVHYAIERYTKSEYWSFFGDFTNRKEATADFKRLCKEYPEIEFRLVKIEQLLITAKAL